MAQINNMNQDDINAFDEVLQKRKLVNPILSMEITKQTDLDLANKLDQVLDAIQTLNMKVDKIFGKQVLIDGRFINIK